MLDILLTSKYCGLFRFRNGGNLIQLEVWITHMTLGTEVSYDHYSSSPGLLPGSGWAGADG